MNLKKYAKDSGSKVAKTESKAAEEGVEILQIVHSDGRKVTISPEDLAKDTVLALQVSELEQAIDAGMDDADVDEYRDAVIRRKESLNAKSPSVGDLVKNAKKTAKVPPKEEPVVNNIDLKAIAPHIGTKVVVPIVRPTMREEKVGKSRVKVFGYVVGEGTTEDNTVISNIMVHSSNGFPMTMKMAIQDGCIIQGELDWDPTKERYILLAPKMVQAAEVSGNSVSILSEWLKQHTAYDAESSKVKSVTWVTLNKEIKDLHPTKVEEFLNEKFQSGIIMSIGQGNSLTFYYEA